MPHAVAAGARPGICFSSPQCQLQAPCWLRNCSNTHPFLSRQMSTRKGLDHPLIPVCVLCEGGIYVCYDEIPCSQTDCSGGLELLVFNNYDTINPTPINSNSLISS